MCNSSPFSGENPLKMRNGIGDYYADFEHIRVGLMPGPKKPNDAPTADAEVQTTHLVPYRCFTPTLRFKNILEFLLFFRLRFWPRCNFKLGPSETSCALKCQCCLMVLGQWLLSQAGLTIILVIWALLGAYAFYVTEGNNYWIL